MVVIWGNILSFIGNVVALAVEVLVFDAFFPRNESRKKRWLCILLWCVIATFLSVSVGTKFGYTLKMLQEVALIYLFCVFFVPKPLGSAVVCRCNGLLCSVFLQSLVR